MRMEVMCLIPSGLRWEKREQSCLLLRQMIKAAKKPVETRYAIQRIENSVDSLSPKRKMAYHFCGAAMVVIPIIFSIAGILLCGFFFYRRKLLLPLGMLSEATQQILDQNLDFNLRYDSEDEMGIFVQLIRADET